MTGTMCVSADLYLVSNIFSIYVKYRLLKKKSRYLLGVKINFGHVH